LPKQTKKQKQEREQQLLSFIATPAASLVIAAGAAVIAIPHVIGYLVRAAELQGLPYVAMLPERIGNAISDHAKATREKLDEKKAEDWHEANPDVTTMNIDVPARSGDPYVDYLTLVGLPLSTVLLVVGDWAGLGAYHRVVGGDWNYYGTRMINGQEYWLLVPKNIAVYYKEKIILDTEEPDEHGLCRVGYTYSASENICEKSIVEQIQLSQRVWPSQRFLPGTNISV